MNKRLFHINILDHPTNGNMIVYFFTEPGHSDYFKKLLHENGMNYEFQEDTDEKKYYFGIDKRYQKQVLRLNYLVFAKYRQPFISNRPARIFILLITVSAIALATLGAILS